MAADILLYQVDQVPVGDDQRQHLELTRDVAVRFNNRYGHTFTVPEATVPKLGARVMDLQRPTRKMSKSVDSPLGTVGLLEAPADIDRKIRRAVTDTDGKVAYDVATKPGVSNLLELLAAATGVGVEEAAARYDGYGELKRDVAEAVIELLAPIQRRTAELRADLGEVERILADGAARAHEVAAVTYAKAAEAVGLYSPAPANRLS
jgi:tryptophanyl-tRNA synthetase